MTDQVTRDYVVVPDTSASATSSTPARATRSRRVPGVTRRLGTSASDKARVLGKEHDVTGVDPAPRSRASTASTWKDGSDAALAELGTDGAIVDRDLAEDARPGGRQPALDAGGDRATKRTFVVRGIYDPPEIQPDARDLVSIAQQAFDTAFPQPAERLRS